MKIAMLVVQGRPKGKCLRLPKGEYLIGRGAECQVRPNSPLVSRQHCLLRVSEQGVHVRDLGSTNGTLIDRVRLTEDQQLVAGDLLQVGPLVLQLLDKVPGPVDTAPVQAASDAGVDSMAGTAADFDALRLLDQKAASTPA